MDIKTATRYIDNPELPEPPAPRGYRTRTDPLAEVWGDVTKLLSADRRLKAYALHEHLLEKFSDKYQAMYSDN